MDLLYVAGSEIQIFHERSKIVDLSLGHTVERCKFFTKDPELWTLLCTTGSKVQVSKVGGTRPVTGLTVQ